MIRRTLGLLLIITACQLLQLCGGTCRASDRKLKRIFKTFTKKCLKRGYESTLEGCQTEGDPSNLKKRQLKRCARNHNILKECEINCKKEEPEEETGTLYTITHETGNGKYDGGNSQGYMFTIIGTEGETEAHDCLTSREKSAIGTCTFRDAADIGDIKSVKIYNSGDNYWRFEWLKVNEYRVGSGEVDDLKTNTYQAYRKDAVEYKVVHKTGTGKYDGGSPRGYHFTVTGIFGKTYANDCIANRDIGFTSGCTFYDYDDIGMIMDVEIYNSGDNYWAFDSLTVNGEAIDSGSVDDHSAEIFYSKAFGRK